MRQMHRSENARRISRILRHCYGWVCCQPSCFLTRGHIHQSRLRRSRFVFVTNDTYELVYVWMPALPPLGEKDRCGFDERRTTTTTTKTKRTTGSPRVLRDRGDRSNAALKTRHTRRRVASKEHIGGGAVCAICFVRVSMPCLHKFSAWSQTLAVQWRHLPGSVWAGGPFHPHPVGPVGGGVFPGYLDKLVLA